MHDDKGIFISATPKPGHEQVVGELFRKLVDFCDRTKAGIVLTGPHHIPKDPALVLTIDFLSQQQKEDFLRLDEYHQFRIDLVEHCDPKKISVLK